MDAEREEVRHAVTGDASKAAPAPPFRKSHFGLRSQAAQGGSVPVDGHGEDGCSGFIAVNGANLGQERGVPSTPISRFFGVSPRFRCVSPRHPHGGWPHGQHRPPGHSPRFRSSHFPSQWSSSRGSAGGDSGVWASS